MVKHREALVSRTSPTARCYKCGTVGLATKLAGTDRETTMIMMGYGKHRGQFFCKDTKACAKRKGSKK